MDDEQAEIKKKNKEIFVAYFKVGLIFQHSFGDTKENAIQSNFKYVIAESGL